MQNDQKVDNNSENITNITTGEEALGSIDPVTDNLTILNDRNELSSNNNTDKKRHKKLFIIIGIIIGIIIIAIVAIFIYIKTGFTATKYIDDKVEEITTFVDEMFMTYNYDADADTIMNGEFSINSNVSELAVLNNLKLNFEVGTSLAKEIVDINFGLANAESDYTANLYINNNRMYLESLDIYDVPLYMDLGENPFASINVEKMNFENYKNAIINFVKYLGIAIKESDMSSSIRGLSAIYRYVINDNNKEAFAQKMNELIEQDENMLDFLEMLGITDATVSADTLSNMVFEVTVSIPSGDLKEFEVTIDNTVMRLEETAKDKYDLIIDEEEVLKVTVNGDNVNLVSADKSYGYYDITFNFKEYTLSADMEVDGDIINLDITNEGNDIKNVVLEVNTTDIFSNETNMLTNLTVEKVSDNEIKTSGDINISTNNESINLTLSLNNQNGYDLVEEKSFNNTKDINTLTDAEENEITTNLMNILSGIVPEVTEDM